jgi:hypothetical protein
MLLIFL